MKKLSLLFVLLIVSISAFSQEEEEEKPDGWSSGGDISLLFSQAAFNNEWQGGGTSNYTGDFHIDYSINYKKDRLLWDNSLLGEYGLTKVKGDEFTRKTNDKLEISSIVGYTVAEDSRWSYSFLLDFRTQFGKGFEYDDDAQTRTESSRFLSPGYLKFGPGMLYKNGEIFKVNISPATARLVFADKKFTTIPGYEDGAYYGMDEGESMRFEFGASVDASSKIALMENVDLKQKISLFSDYLDKPQNVSMDYTLRLDMKINKFLTTNFTFQAIYDDKAVSAFQIREVLGVGFNYSI